MRDAIRTHRVHHWLALLLLCLAARAGAAYTPLTTQQVADQVYALIGETGPRSAQNHALNNNLAFIVTPQGVILVDTGATPRAARLIEAAIAQVTNQPIRWVINTGSQDHRWLGNSYFAERGAQLLALERTVRVQREYAHSHIQRLSGVLGDQAREIRPVHAAGIAGDRAHLNLGGTRIELIWPGDAHFPGDAIVWLPQQRTVITGDLVYVDRMPGILPHSRVVQWGQECRYLVKDFGTSQSPKSTRQRDSRYCPDRPALITTPSRTLQQSCSCAT
ncbi:MAG: hypothetical protein B0D96_02155, partial [Candidatus Sedimenticola endophacoides]